MEMEILKVAVEEVAEKIMIDQILKEVTEMTEIAEEVTTGVETIVMKETITDMRGEEDHMTTRKMKGQAEIEIIATVVQDITTEVSQEILKNLAVLTSTEDTEKREAHTMVLIINRLKKQRLQIQVRVKKKRQRTGLDPEAINDVLFILSGQ